MTKVGKNLTVKFDKDELIAINTALISVLKDMAIQHFVKSEGMSNEEAASKVEAEKVFIEHTMYNDAIYISNVEVDVFVKE